MWAAASDAKGTEYEKLYFRHKPVQAVASVPDKDGTLCSSVQFRREYFGLV